MSALVSLNFPETPAGSGGTVVLGAADALELAGALREQIDQAHHCGAKAVAIVGETAKVNAAWRLATATRVADAIESAARLALAKKHGTVHVSPESARSSSDAGNHP